MRAGSADCCLGGEPRDPIARSTSLHWLPPGRAGAAGRYRWQASGWSVAPHRRGLPTRTGRAVDTGPMYTMDSASVNCEARAQTRHRARAPRARTHVWHRARGGPTCASPPRVARGPRAGRVRAGPARGHRARGGPTCASPPWVARGPRWDSPLPLLPLIPCPPTLRASRRPRCRGPRQGWVPPPRA